MALAESGNNGGSQPRSNAPRDFASARVANRVVTTSLHPVSASSVMMKSVARILRRTVIQPHAADPGFPWEQLRLVRLFQGNRRGTAAESAVVPRERVRGCLHASGEAGEEPSLRKPKPGAVAAWSAASKDAPASGPARPPVGRRCGDAPSSRPRAKRRGRVGENLGVAAATPYPAMARRPGGGLWRQRLLLELERLVRLTG